MALAEWERTTDVDIDQFFEFVNFVISQGHGADAIAHLKSAGFEKIRVSVQPIRAIQELLKQKYASTGSAGASVVITSAHVDGVCGGI